MDQVPSYPRREIPGHWIMSTDVQPVQDLLHVVVPPSTTFEQIRVNHPAVRQLKRESRALFVNYYAGSKSPSNLIATDGGGGEVVDTRP